MVSISWISGVNFTPEVEFRRLVHLKLGVPKGDPEPRRSQTLESMIFRFYVKLGGGFKDFSFSPLFGEMIQFD